MSSGCVYANASEPSAPAPDTAATSSGVLGPPAMGAWMIGTRRPRRVVNGVEIVRTRSGAPEGSDRAVPQARSRAGEGTIRAVRRGDKVPLGPAPSLPGNKASLVTLTLPATRDRALRVSMVAAGGEPVELFETGAPEIWAV